MAFVIKYDFWLGKATIIKQFIELILVDRKLEQNMKYNDVDIGGVLSKTLWYQQELNTIFCYQAIC